MITTNKILDHNPRKYHCLKAPDGRWIVRTPCVYVHPQGGVVTCGIFDRTMWHQFPSFREALLFLRAHLRMDEMGVPRG